MSVQEEGNQRRFPRIASHHAVLVTRMGENSLEEIVQTRTVGLGGCCFLSDESLGVGSTLSLLLSVDRHVAKATGRVVYERQALNDPRMEVGVEFIDITPRDLEMIRNLFDSHE